MMNLNYRDCCARIAASCFSPRRGSVSSLPGLRHRFKKTSCELLEASLEVE